MTWILQSFAFKICHLLNRIWRENGHVWLVNAEKPPSFIELVWDKMAHLLMRSFICPRCSNLMATHVRYRAATENECYRWIFFAVVTGCVRWKLGIFAERVLKKPRDRLGHKRSSGKVSLKKGEGWCTPSLLSAIQLWMISIVCANRPYRYQPISEPLNSA